MYLRVTSVKEQAHVIVS